MDRGELRAGDADRARVAERLRIALDEGRLNLYEYDERLRDAYAAKTYADLDRLLADLPATVPPGRAQLVPASTGAIDTAGPRWQVGPDGRYRNATRAWLVNMWDSWASATGICVAIWAVLSLFAGELTYFWPGWVGGPWGAVLLVQSIGGLMRGEPQRWAAKRARAEREREVRRQAKGDDGGGARSED